MGVVTVYLPTSEQWAKVAPLWAMPYWNALHMQLFSWCIRERIPLKVDETARVYHAS